MRIKKLVLSIKNWVRENPAEFWILIVILAVGAFCRLYKIDQYMTFLGDEGRDAIIVRRIFTELHPPLIGPGTSVGNMYLGPLYYYLMALPLLIAGFSPVGPAVMVAVLGIITIAFVWWVGCKWFDKNTGLIAAALYAISPTVIYYSKSSWNPNIMPFFALLSVYSIWKVWKERKFNWLIVMGISFAFVLQSHYLGLLIAPTLFLFWILTLIKIKSKKEEVKSFIRSSLLGLLLFVILMSPLFFFDVRHNWMNTKAIYTFFTMKDSSVSVNPLAAISKIPVLINQIGFSLVGCKNIIAGIVASAVFAVCFVLFLINIIKAKKSQNINPAYYILLSWIGFALVGLGFYKQNIYDHYLGFVFVVPFLLVGIFISKLLISGKLLKISGVVLLAFLIVINLIKSPLRAEPNKLLQRSIDVSKLIEKESGEKPLNLAVIADSNYEAGYEYFLLKDNYPVIEIDPQRPDTITNQLFAVCELIPNSKCDPTHNPKAQIANFGWSKIDASWNIDGVIVYRLLHSN